MNISEKLQKSIPIPISGLMLGLATLGNLLGSFDNRFRNICGILSGTIMILLTIRILLNIDTFKEEMKNPVLASVISTYPMNLVVLATYIKPSIPVLGNVFWYAGVALHIVVIIYFTKTFLLKFDRKKVFASWFPVYVGVNVAAITGANFNPTVGKICFYFGTVCYIVLLPIIFRRIYIDKDIPENLMPTIGIIIAPASLCLAGYLNIIGDINFNVFVLLLAATQITFILFLSKLKAILKVPFNPSYASLTFPLAILALATNASRVYLEKIELGSIGITRITYIETVMAIIFIIYVLLSFVKSWSKMRTKESI